MNKWVKLLKDLRETYDEIYALERKRVEINKKLNLRKNKLTALLNYLRIEGREEEDLK